MGRCALNVPVLYLYLAIKKQWAWARCIIHNIGLNNRCGRSWRTKVDVCELSRCLSGPLRCLMNKLSDGMQSTKNNDKNRRMNYYFEVMRRTLKLRDIRSIGLHGEYCHVIIRCGHKKRCNDG